jgi:hypothetical protein
MPVALREDIAILYGMRGGVQPLRRTATLCTGWKAFSRDLIICAGRFYSQSALNIVSF